MAEASRFSNVEGVLAAIRRAAANLVPPPDLAPSAWAEANVRIPVGNAIPGPITFANAPYQRGMIDAVREPGITRLTMMTGAQLGKTTIQQCITGYFIAHEPRSQILVQPSQGDMQTFLETKLRPMLDANPAIADKMARPRGREGVNNSRIISYVGGWLMMSWAGSPKTLRGRSAPVTQADEIDGMEATAEGDPVQLLTQRAATFGDQRLLVESSTPTVKGASRVEAAFLAGDQRRYWVPCPHCGEHQVLRWAQVQWMGRCATPDEDAAHPDAHQPETARYACEHCGALWDDGERIAAIRAGQWRAGRPFKGHASFHLPELCSTFRRLRDIVQSYLDKIAVDDLQSFVNVSLAETFEEAGEKADAEGIKARREVYAAPVPAGGLYLTAGIDMQQDRLELEIVAWGLGEESWSVDYRVLWGDPLGDDVWHELDDVLDETFLHASGAQLPISAACLDTGGTAGYTQRAYDYAQGKTGRRLFAIKGQGGWGIPIVQSPQRRRPGRKGRKVDLFAVGVDEAKLIVMRRLAKTTPGPGYCHVPAERDDDWFRQITAETMVTRYVRGQPVREWRKPDHARNEALDCRVYALAALKIMQPSLKRLAERLREPVPPVPSAPPEPAAAVAAPAENPPEDTPAPRPETARIKRSQGVRKRGGWVGNW